jgi:uncharacterized protein
MSYHLRRSEREIKDKNELISILERGKYGIIGLSKDNEPYVVTLSYGYDKVKNVLYFHCAKAGQKIDFIKSNPRACVTIIEDNAFDADSCDHSYKSLILRGTMSLVNDTNEVDRGIRLMIAQLEKKDPDRFLTKLGPGNKSFDDLQMLKLTIESITGKAR